MTASGAISSARSCRCSWAARHRRCRRSPSPRSSTPARSRAEPNVPGTVHRALLRRDAPQLDGQGRALVDHPRRQLRHRGQRGRGRRQLQRHRAGRAVRLRPGRWRARHCRRREHDAWESRIWPSCRRASGPSTSTSPGMWCSRSPPKRRWHSRRPMPRSMPTARPKWRRANPGPSPWAATACAATPRSKPMHAAAWCMPSARAS